MSQFQAYNDQCKDWVNTGLNRYLDARLSNNCLLAEPIHYSVLNGGKRIRAMLVHAACLLASGNVENALSAACAVEFLHSYSLVHDDLPAMDDDDFRRGKPSCHKAFGEASAILTGDALQALAFEILATSPRLNEELRLHQVTALAKAAGCQGMIAGQSLDMALTGCATKATLETLETMHEGKTGALICASLAMGAYAANAEHKIHEALAVYGKAIGLAFQVQDDILDETSDSEILGKPQGSDKEKGKATYVSLLGIEGASRYLLTLLNQANEALSDFKSEADPLRWLARYIVDRMY